MGLNSYKNSLGRLVGVKIYELLVDFLFKPPAGSGTKKQ